MFKLVVLSGLLAVALAKPSALVSPLSGKLVSEKTIESHGNSVIHAAAPVITSAVPLLNPVEHVVPVAPLIAAKPATIISEKTIESHGHSIVHHSAPAATVSYVAPTVPVVATAAPVVVTETKLVDKSEKPHESFEKSSPQSKQLIEKIESIAQQSNQVQGQDKIESNSIQSSDAQQRNESATSKEFVGKIESQGHFIIHQAAPAVLTYHAAAVPAVPAVPTILGLNLTPNLPARLSSPILPPQSYPAEPSDKPQSVEKVKSAEVKQQFPERFENLDNGAIHEVATGLHLAAAPVYYYPYPAAVVAEKSISSYGHSIIHGI